MPKPRTAEVVIFTGDHLDRIRHIERKYKAARDAYEDAAEGEGDSSQRVGTVPESVILKERSDELAREHDEEVERAEAAAIRVRVTTVRRKQYRALADAHPPREDNAGDATLGVNQMTFREALVPAAIAEVTEDGKTKRWSDKPGESAEPKGGDYSDAEREDFLDTLAESDMERLFAAAYHLVNGFMADPKMLASHSSQQTPENAAS